MIIFHQKTEKKKIVKYIMIFIRRQITDKYLIK